MTDRELLELAAKAAGYVVEYDDGRFSKRPGFKTYGQMWNPLIDDGDALRLAVALKIDLHIPASKNQVFVQVGDKGDTPFVLERIEDCHLAATRRAIVRAAAEIGRNMK